MNFKNLPASLLLALGGILTLISSVPLVSDFFPLVLFPGGQMTFLGTRLPNRVTITQINGWTFIGFSGYEIAIFFMGVGALGLFFALNTYFNFIPFDEIKGIPLNALAGIIIGVADVGLLLLIYISPTTNVDGWGLSALTNFSLNGVGSDAYYSPTIIGASLGIGFFLLISGAILLVLGGIINLVFKPTSSKVSSA